MSVVKLYRGTWSDTSHRLSEDEEEQFQQALEQMDLEIKERVMEFTTDWQEKGREQGKQEGLQQGLIAKGQEDILRILEFRFEEIQPELRELIGKIDDLEVLGNLLIQAVTTQSLEAFASVANQQVANEVSGLENGEQSSGEGENESD